MAQESQVAAAPENADLQKRAWRKLPKRLFITLVALDTFFVGVYLYFVAFGRHKSLLFQVFNLDREANVPSWYAGTQLFLIAIGYLVLGSRLIPDRRKVAVLRPLWILMGVGFTLLSADEVGALHERMGHALKHMKVFSFRYLDQWMVLYLLIAVCIALIFSKQLLRVWKEWRFEVLLFLLGFAVLASGAFVAEIAQISRRWVGTRHLLQIGVEEWLELVGATILTLPAYRILSYAMTSDPDSDQIVTPAA